MPPAIGGNSQGKIWMPIHPKTFAALLGPNPQIETRDGVKSTGKVLDIDNLYLIVGEKTQRSWVYRYSFNGVAGRELALGSAHKVGLTEAREKAAAAFLLLKAGKDPKVERDAAKAAAKEALRVVEKKTLYVLAKEAVAVIGPPSESGKGQWLRMLQPHLTEGLTDKAPGDVTRDDVIRCLEAVQDRAPTCAMRRKVQGALYGLFEWCAAGGRYLPEDAPNPADFKGRNKHLIRPLVRDGDHHAAIGWREIGATVAKLREYGTVVDMAVEWTLLSAVRVGNTYQADWSQIDFEARVWTIPAKFMKVKNVGAHRVPLTDRHLEILAAVAPESGVPSSGLIFKNRSGGAFKQMGTLYSLRRAYPHLIERENGPARYASMHGLRATFRTWGDHQLDPKTKDRLYSRELLEFCLAHVVGDAAEQAYRREDNVEARRPIMEAWAKFVSKPYQTVAPFRRAS